MADRVAFFAERPAGGGSGRGDVLHCAGHAQAEAFWGELVYEEKMLQ